MQAEIEFDERDNIVMKINNHKIVLKKDFLFRNCMEIKIDDSDFFPLPFFYGKKPTEKIFNTIHQGDEKTINMLKIASVALQMPQLTINNILGVEENYKNIPYETKIKKLYRSVVRAFQRKLRNNWKVDSDVKYVKTVLEDLGEEKLSNKLWSWWLATKFKS